MPVSDFLLLLLFSHMIILSSFFYIDDSASPLPARAPSPGDDTSPVRASPRPGNLFMVLRLLSCGLYADGFHFSCFFRWC